jgi:cob(I)alamin adenosyltransferase
VSKYQNNNPVGQKYAVILSYLRSFLTDRQKRIRYNPTMKKFYTSGGDDGTTGLLGEDRVPKHHLRIQAVGTVDEASAALGIARAQVKIPEINQLVKNVQEDLYRIMSLLVLEKPNPEKFPDLKNDRLDWLENKIDLYGGLITPPSGFILPGDTLPSAAFGLARTIVRRAERVVVQLHDQGQVFSEIILPYLNRLSSLCFVLELYTTSTPTPTPDNKL